MFAENIPVAASVAFWEWIVFPSVDNAHGFDNSILSGDWWAGWLESSRQPEQTIAVSTKRAKGANKAASPYQGRLVAPQSPKAAGLFGFYSFLFFWWSVGRPQILA